MTEKNMFNNNPFKKSKLYRALSDTVKPYHFNSSLDVNGHPTMETATTLPWDLTPKDLTPKAQVSHQKQPAGHPKKNDVNTKIIRVTPPKFNIFAPEKSWLEDDPFFLGWYIFTGYVKLPGGTSNFLYKENATV